jgi:hypothetical protein
MIGTINESLGCKSSVCAPSELQIGANYGAPATAQWSSHRSKEADPENSRSRKSDLQHSPVISH